MVVPADHWQERRVLVTGGAGFIGSALVWALNQRQCTTIVVADFPPSVAKQRHLAFLRVQEYVAPNELLDRASTGWLREFDTVLHMGACSSTTETDVDYLRRNNYQFTKVLAEAALSSGTRFVYASSAATYGDGSEGMDDSSPQNLDRLKPLNPYGESKHAFDLYAWREGWLDHIVGLKYFNVFGPNEDHKGDMRSVVNKSYRQILEAGTIKLFKSYRDGIANGEQRRDFLYIKDAVEMTLHLAEAPTTAGLFNIGSGEAHTWNELAQAVFSSLSSTPRIEYVDMPKTIRDKYQYFTRAKIEKLRKAGYEKPVTSLREAVYDYIVHYLGPDKVLGQEETRSSQ